MEHSKYDSSVVRALFVCAGMLLLTKVAASQERPRPPRPSPTATPLPAIAQEATPAQPAGRQAVESLVPNVVRIEARLRDHTENGFGFIVGERGGTLYVVTAYHVVSDKEAVGEDSPVTVKLEFSDHQGTVYDANLLGTHDVDIDLAVVTVQAPPGFQWKKTCLGRDEDRKLATRVWFIGRSQKWYVPVSPGRVASDDSTDSQIELEGLAIRPGSSGGPLVASSGIVGMIVRDSADEATALSISFIKAAFHRWNHPWSLESGPVPKMTPRSEQPRGIGACADGRLPSNEWHDAAAPNGSWDWNCNGQIERQWGPCENLRPEQCTPHTNATGAPPGFCTELRAPSGCLPKVGECGQAGWIYPCFYNSADGRCHAGGYELATPMRCK